VKHVWQSVVDQSHGPLQVSIGDTCPGQFSYELSVLLIPLIMDFQEERLVFVRRYVRGIGDSPLTQFGSCDLSSLETEERKLPDCAPWSGASS